MTKRTTRIRLEANIRPGVMTADGQLVKQGGEVDVPTADEHLYLYPGSGWRRVTEPPADEAATITAAEAEEEEPGDG